MLNKFKFSSVYNEIDDILSVYDLSKSVHEIFEFSEFLNISLDKMGCIVGLEIFDASKFFEFQNPEVDFKKFFLKLTSVEVEQKQFRGNWLLLLYLYSGDMLVKQQLPPFRRNAYKSPLLCSC